MYIEMANLMRHEDIIEPQMNGHHGGLIRNKHIQVVNDNDVFHPIWESSLRNLPTYPRRILRWRNIIIPAAFIQITAAIIGMGLYSLRRNPFFLFLNPFCLILALIGLLGAKNMNKWMIGTHAVTTTALFGSFMFFQVIEALFRKKREQGDSVDETYLLLLFSLPYLVDFIVGVLMFYFLGLILTWEDSQKSNNVFHTEEKFFLQLPDGYNNEERQCVICLDRPKSAVFYDCGHKICCMECAKRLRGSYLSSCPLCRAHIKDVIQQYD